ncbi:hypothetical protein V8E55_008992 [Tylopilus felleus]
MTVCDFEAVGFCVVKARTAAGGRFRWTTNMWPNPPGSCTKHLIANGVNECPASLVMTRGSIAQPHHCGKLLYASGVVLSRHSKLRVKMFGIERDDQLYMTLVTIQVENRLFRVPRQSLESQSRVFRDMFTLPANRDAKGANDNNPIRLDGVTKEEFKRFLEVLLLGAYEETTPEDSIFQRWFPILKLAKMWGCDAMHKHAIKKMPYNQIDKTLIEKVKLAVQYDMPHWVLSGVNELAQRKEPLGMDDFACLGPELTLKVAAVRESLGISSDRGGFYCGAATLIAVNGPRDASTVDFTPAIKGVFQLSDDDAKNEMDAANAPKRGLKRKAQ